MLHSSDSLLPFTHSHCQESNRESNSCSGAVYTKLAFAAEREMEMKNEEKKATEKEKNEMKKRDRGRNGGK